MLCKITAVIRHIYGADVTRSFYPVPRDDYEWPIARATAIIA